MSSSTHKLTAIMDLKNKLSGKLTAAIKQLEKMNQTTDQVSKTSARTSRKVSADMDKMRTATTGMTKAVVKAGEAEERYFKDQNGRMRAASGQFVKTKGTASSFFRSMSNEASRGAGIFSKFSASVHMGAISMRTKLLGVVAAVGGITAGWKLLNATVGGAMRLEQEQIAMEHFIGLTDKKNAKKKTDEYIAWLRQNANVTPFETNEVIAAGRRSINITSGDITQAKQLLEISENMAALNPGKTVMDAMEALADLKVGETERMKEFGFKISQADLQKAGGGKSTAAVSAGAMKMMLGPIAKTFDGGATKLGQSGAGMLSTITGSASSAMTDIGVKSLEKIKPTLAKLAEYFSGNGLDKFINKASDALAEFFDKLIQFGYWVMSLKPKLDQLIAFYQKHEKYIKPLIKGIGLAIAAFMIIMPIIEVVGAALAFLTSPIGLIIAGLVLLYAAWTGNWGGIQEKTKAVIDWMMPYIKMGWDYVMSVFNVVKNYIVGIMPLFLQAVKNVWSIIGPIIIFAAQTIWTAIKLYFGLIWDFMKMVFGFIGNLISTWWTIVSGIFKAFLQVLNGDFAGAWETVKATIGSAVDKIKGTIQDLIDGALNMGRDFFQGFVDGIMSVWAKFEKTLNKVGNAVASVFGKKNKIEGGDVEGGGSGIDSHNAGGLSRVPYDGYVSSMHKGERILTPEENEAYNSGLRGGVHIAKIADTVIVREEADMDKLANKLAHTLWEAGGQM